MKAPGLLTQLGILSALASAGLLGLTPVFGKLAIGAGVAPVAVVALRTALAALLLLLPLALLRRRYLYIYPAGLLGCLLAGTLNGIGSLFYYLALGRLEASLAAMLYALYPVFVAMVAVGGQTERSAATALSRLTWLRLGLGLPAVLLLTRAGFAQVDWIGAGFMLAASLLYALHLIANQQVLNDMPAPTVTLYTLLAMTLVVVPAQLFSFGGALPALPAAAWTPLLGLTAVTFLSRLAVFYGVKRLGGVQTAMLGLGELIVSLAVARAWLGETLTTGQWAGAAVLLASLALVIFEPPQAHMALNISWLRWIRPPKPQLPPEVEIMLGRRGQRLPQSRPARGRREDAEFP